MSYYKLSSLYKPARDIVKVFIRLQIALEDTCHIFFLASCLLPTSLIRRVPADIGLSALILEVDLCLVERRMKQVAGVMFHAGSGRRTDAEPIEPQGVAAGDPVLGIER
jgi:hypothetical protein